jgi:hypothetical protein
MNFIDCLLWTPTSEGEPAVESSRPLFATPTGPDADGRCGSLNHVAETDVLIADETRKAHAVWLVFTLRLFVIHDIYDLSGPSVRV